MRAVQFMRYGSADVLESRDIAEPTARDGEAIVRVAATSVNAHDVFVRSGAMRALTRSRFPLGTGVDFAGEIRDPGATGIAVGEQVWGTLRGFAHRGSAAAAELVAVPATQLSRSPRGMKLPEAAALVAGGTAALTGVRDIARLREGEHILIRGAAGSVGNAAVQYAASLGAQVTTLTSAAHRDLAVRLGANHDRDYRTTNVGDLGRFDVIFDTVGSQLTDYRRLLTPTGRMVSVAASSWDALRAIAMSSVHGPRRIRTFLGRPDRALLDDLAALATRGSIRPLIDTLYDLDDAAEAHRQFERGGSTGKHVLIPTW